MKSDVAKKYEFLKTVGNLKRVARAGWVLKGIHDAESVAEHDFRTAILAEIYAKEPLDARKIVLTALLNDVAQSRSGDIIWEHGKQQDVRAANVKANEELRIAESMLDLVERPDLKQLLKEYIMQSTPEARFVKELDKIEMVLQALEYEAEIVNPQELREFWENAERYIETPELKELFAYLKTQSQIRFTDR
jgi:putative hydrolase of HD superfamily